LIDENLPPVIASQLRRREPDLPALAIGQSNALAKGTPDPQILHWLEENDYFLVTNNRTSMPDHLHDYLAVGGHIPGILIVPFPLGIGQLLEELILIWAAAHPGEFQDQIIHLPLKR
jgi:Domain of unknown function (DUF5615)